MPSDNAAVLNAAKQRLDKFIKDAHFQAYKPIAIAETLYHARQGEDISDFAALPSNSLRWGAEISNLIVGRETNSTYKFKRDIWGAEGLSSEMLDALSAVNNATAGAIERYIYLYVNERHQTVASMMMVLRARTQADFKLDDLLGLFAASAINRSIGKAYEIVAYSLLDTLAAGLEANVAVTIPVENEAMRQEFSGITEVLFGISGNMLQRTQAARIYRAGVTNAADKGIDMWANFGPVVQVKYSVLSPKMASKIVGELKGNKNVEIIIVCKRISKRTAKEYKEKTGWAERVSGIITESDLITNYAICLRGNNKDVMTKQLLMSLRQGFEAEFPQINEIEEFLDKRGYTSMTVPDFWRTKTDDTLNG